MADATNITPSAPAVITPSRSETPQNSVTNSSKSVTPPIKTEKPDDAPREPSRLPSQPTPSRANPTDTPTPSSTTPAPGLKSEAPKSSGPPGPATPANKPLSISIPTTTNGPVVTPSATVAAPAASSTSGAPFSTLAHIFSNPIGTPAISPLSDAEPATKRPRTPEAEEEHGKEKRQKLSNGADDLDKLLPLDSAPVHPNGQIENDAGDSSMPDWDLNTQIQNILHLVPEPAEDEANKAAENGKSDLPPLPPPRPRLEKMKYIENPTYFARAMGLPTLGSLSVQILLALFQQPSEVTDRQIRDVRTEGGKIYTQLRSTFMALLKLFVDSPTFLNADDLDINEPGDRETIQMANLASMCASFYGPGGPTMATAHDNFLKIMIPENGIITQEIAALYLDQKTQSFLAYANVMEDKEATRNSLMEKFFPGDLEDKLRAHWNESNLTEFLPADDFVQPFTDRRHLLKVLGHDKEQRKALESKYQFASFLDSLSAFIRSNFDSILDYAESHGVEVPNEAGEEDLMLMHAQSTYAGSYPGQPRRNGDPDTAGLAMLISEKFAGEEGYTYGYGASSAIPESKILPPGQSLPTSVLYERARQAAVAKSNLGARREGLQSTRRPWTPEEEKALMAGLDMVKGPHWSQILQLFGPNGTIKDILKDRTQVQLKDKARNLKLFFLKTNSEVPYYLQSVTGELKTRAPSQAAKKEAEELARAGGPSNGYGYMTAPSNGTTGPAAHGLPVAAAPRPGTTPPVSGSTTPAGVNPSHPSQQQYQQPHQQPQQQYQQQQSYQQPRPQQLQPAPNGAARTPVPTGHHPAPQATKPSGPHSSHQPIAPAPSYQRPLQQAGAPSAPQYQQRPTQQSAGQPPPTTYQQASRPAGQPPSNNPPPRPNYSSPTPQGQPRVPTPSGPGAPAAPRPIQAVSTAPPRPASTQTVTSAPSPGPGQGLRGIPPPHNIPRTLTPASAIAATGPPKTTNQPPVPAAVPQGPTRPSQPSAALAATGPGHARPVQQPAAQPPRLPQQPAVAKQTPTPEVQQRPAPAVQQPPAPGVQQTSAPAAQQTPAPALQQTPAPAVQPPPAQPPQSAPKSAAVPQTTAAPAPTQSVPPGPAVPRPSGATSTPAPAVPQSAPDKVEANVELLGQSMKKGNFV